MNIIEGQIKSQYLFKIKQIIDEDINGDKFIIVRRNKNIEFMRQYGLDSEDIKYIIRSLSVEDCFAGPEEDRNPKYEGWIFKFKPIFENIGKSVCLSVHEFGKYDEVN